MNRSLIKLSGILLVLVFLLCSVSLIGAAASDEGDVLSLSPEAYAEWKAGILAEDEPASLLSSNTGYIRNEFIEAYINESGHYTMGTTGGNPESSTDDNKLLLYGHPGSNTTETLILVDGAETYFSASDTTFSADNKQVVSVATFNGVEVKQILTLENNAYTGNADVISIKYVLTNKSSTAKQIGGRIMLDTMLGSNDGAPFRLPNVGNVTYEREYIGNQIPEYWQAFDNLSEPRVIATGNFYRENGEKPDKVQFAAWPKIKSSSWDFAVNESRSVTSDSAVAAYFNPRTVLPGASRTIVTYYGISNFTSSDVGGDLSVRVTAPSALGSEGGVYLNNPFVVTAYIGNNTGADIRNLRAQIVLPRELQIEGSDGTLLEIPDLYAGLEQAVKWTVRAFPQDTEKTVTYKIIISGDNVDTKEVSVDLLLHKTEDLYRTITFNLNGADGTPPAAQRVPVGAKGTEPTKPRRSGYVFKGWFANAECLGDVSWFDYRNVGALLRTNENITLYAKWEKLEVGLNDLYGFLNSYDSFGTSPEMSSEYFDILTEDAPAAIKALLWVRKQLPWGGSCYGMGVTEALFLSGDLTQSFFQDNVTTTRQLDMPIRNSKVESLIQFYQLAQGLREPMRAMNTGFNKKTQPEMLEDLVTRARAIDSADAYLCIILSKYSAGILGIPCKDGTHTVIAYSMETTPGGKYRINLFESNDNTSIRNSYLLIESDYSNAVFHCGWDYNGISIADNTMTLDGILGKDAYGCINLQEKLIDRGYEVAPFASPETFDYDSIDISYPNAIIRNKEGKQTQIQNRSIASEAFMPLGISMNGGNLLSVLYTPGEYYSIMTPDMNEDSYTTSILLNKTDYILANTELSSVITVEKDQSVAVESIGENVIEISITENEMPWSACYVRIDGESLTVRKNGNTYIAQSPNGFTNAVFGIRSAESKSGITVNSAETELVLTPVSENGKYYLEVKDAAQTLGKAEMKYSVVFYTYGGSHVDDIVNIEKSSTIAKPADPVFDGFTFAGWYKSAECLDGEAWNFASDTVEENTVLHAKWLPNEDYMHSVTFRSTGFDDIIILVKDGDSLTDIPAVPYKRGCSGQWDVTDFTNIRSNLIVNAIYQLNGTGDVNMDGAVNKLDLLRLQKYLAGWDVEIDENAADTNGDGIVSKADLLRLQKYLAGWNVILGQ